MAKQFSWEQEYKRTWEDRTDRAASEFTMEAGASYSNTRKGIVRHLHVVIDVSEAIDKPDFLPTFRTNVARILEGFIPSFYTENPLSTLSFLSARDVCVRYASSMEMDIHTFLGQTGSRWFSLVNALEGSVEIMRASERAAGLTRQLLAFSRKQLLEPRVVSLNTVLHDLGRMLERLIGEDIDLFWKPALGLWLIHMDPAQLDQILANLAVNARDAIASVGKITIETGNVEFDETYCETHAGFVPGQYVLLAVSDNGCGMDKETMAQLFDPFFTTKPSGQGTGLGLAMVYGIVKQNRGFINVYSEPGKGTTFKIYLPRHGTDKADASAPPVPAVAPTGTETVLLVEDEEALLQLVATQLEGLGYRVLADTRDAGETALRMPVKRHSACRRMGSSGANCGRRSPAVNVVRPRYAAGAPR